MHNGKAILENSLVVSCTVKYILNIRPSNLTLRHLFERNKNVCFMKKWYINVYSGFFIVFKNLTPTSHLYDEWLEKL